MTTENNDNAVFILKSIVSNHKIIGLSTQDKTLALKTIQEVEDRGHIGSHTTLKVREKLNQLKTYEA